METVHTPGGFDWKQFIKSILLIATPVALQNLLTTTGSMVDTMMIAPLGEASVGALGLCAQFSSLLFSCYWGFVGGGMLFLSQYWGAKDHDGINRAYGTSLVCMVIVSLVFACLAIFAPDFVMSVYTDKTVFHDVGIQYLRIVGFAYPLQIISTAMSTLLRTTEKVRIPLISSLVSVATNFIFNLILINGYLGFPALGVRGAAIATVLAAAVNILVIVLMAKRIRYSYLFQIKKHFRWSRAWLRKYFTKCFPIICNELFIGIGNMVINIVLGRQSARAVAAISVFRTLEGFVIAFFMGFSIAASILVGKCVGSGKLRTAYERAIRLVPMCAGVILVVCLLLFAIHEPLLHAMSLSGESFEIGTGLLLIYCVAAAIRMSNWTQNDTYRASGDSTFGTILEIIFMYVLVLPCVCLSGLYFELPVLAVFACCYIDEPIRLILMQIHMYSGKWIKPVTPEGKAALPAFHAELDRKRHRGSH